MPELRASDYNADGINWMNTGSMNRISLWLSGHIAQSRNDDLGTFGGK